MDDIKKDGYIFRKSTNPKKKYDVFKHGKKLTSFGGIRDNKKPYEQYYDKIGLYSDYNHNDKIRRERYRLRHNKKMIINSANYFSHKYLW